MKSTTITREEFNQFHDKIIRRLDAIEDITKDLSELGDPELVSAWLKVGFALKEMVKSEVHIFQMYAEEFNEANDES